MMFGLCMCLVYAKGKQKQALWSYCSSVGILTLGAVVASREFELVFVKFAIFKIYWRRNKKKKRDFQSRH